MSNKLKTIGSTVAACSLAVMLTACGGDDAPKAAAPAAAPVQTGISPQKMADAIHKVIEADRAVYSKLIINRLVKEEKVIKASEHWKEDKALVLPAQMLRAAAERVMEDDGGFSFSLLSEWPINSQNKAKTDMEKKGLAYINANPGQNFYGEESLGGTTYFTAVYPDVAVAEACASCHNDHKDSPRTDFKVGDVMGGVVIRIPL